MAEENQPSRRLAAILAADVVGYSRMMSDNEAGTLAALKHHRGAIFNPIVAAHNGRVVKLIGDGTLVEFASVVDAVKCALAIQRSVEAERHSGRGSITLRIGVNLGDVMIDGDDIYGEGVNVAARLESLADPGGICVSSIVVESMGNRIDITFADSGEVKVKNIDRPVRIWKWHPDDRDGAARTQRSQIDQTTHRGEQASIAVLAFNNLSGDPEQDYFSDGITEDIITDLSKIADLLVIARNSSFAYKGTTPDIRVVGRELGVTSVLEGSIRRAGNRVRITAQLIDTTNGAHLWAERYDRELTDIFAVQDDVTRNIVDALKLKLAPRQTDRIADVPTRSTEAHDLFLRGREALLGSHNTKEMFELAVQCFERAIEIDPDYAEPYAGLAHAYNRDFQNKWTGRTDSQDLSAHFSKIALEKGPELPYAHYTAGLVKFWERDAEGSVAAIERALKLNPNFTMAMAMRGLDKIYGGAPLDAVPDLERAIRLDPLMGHQYWHFIGTAYLLAERYDEAVEAFRERIRRSPDTDLTRGLLISALGHLGHIDEARRVWSELKQVNPRYSFAEHVARLPIREPADADRIREGFGKLDLPD